MQKFIVGFILLYCTNFFAQQRIAEYTDITNDIFAGLEKPISIVIFPFVYNNEHNTSASVFYDKLSTALKKESNFILNFYSKLESLKEEWGIKDWDPQKAKLLKRLSTELDIRLVVYAVLSEPGGEAFTLKIINITNKEEIYSQEYLPSSNSTAIDDAIKLFTDNKTVKYKYVLETGPLIINTSPAGEFKVYLNDQLAGLTPYENNSIPKGEYKLTIHDPKYNFKDYKEIFYFDPNQQSSLKKDIVLSPLADSLNASPAYFRKLKPTTSNTNVAETESHTASSDKGKSQGFTSLLFIISYPQGDFCSTNGNQPGYAQTGNGGALEFDIPLWEILNWMLCASVSENSFNKNAMQAQDANSYIEGMILTGFRLRIPFSDLSEIYLLGHVGLLISQFPNITWQIESFTEDLKVDPATAFVYGTGVGLKLGVLDFGVRYYYGEPEYNLKFSINANGNESSTMKQKLPYSVLFLTVGLRF